LEEKIGWKATPGEQDHRGILRSLVLSKLGSAGDENTIAEAKRQLKNRNDLVADLRAVVYKICIISEQPGENLWDEVLDIFRKSEMQEEKDRCARSLGWSHDKAKLEKTMDWALNSGEVRSQDTVFVIASVSANPVGRELEWEWLQKNWDAVSGKFAGQFLLSRLVTTSCSVFASDKRADEVEKFFSDKKVASAERAVKQAIESIRSNAGWWSRDSQDIVRWLNEKY